MRYLVLLDGQVDQSILGVYQLLVVEVVITSEKSWAAQLLQEDNDLVILQSAPPNVEPDLSWANTPVLQQLTLAGRYVFVQDIHAAAGSTMNSSACRSKA